MIYNRPEYWIQNSFGPKEFTVTITGDGSELDWRNNTAYCSINGISYVGEDSVIVPEGTLIFCYANADSYTELSGTHLYGRDTYLGEMCCYCVHSDVTIELGIDSYNDRGLVTITPDRTDYVYKKITLSGYLTADYSYVSIADGIMSSAGTYVELAGSKTTVLVTVGAQSSSYSSNCSITVDGNVVLSGAGTYTYETDTSSDVTITFSRTNKGSIFFTSYVYSAAITTT